MDYMKLAQEDLPTGDHWHHVLWAIVCEVVDNAWECGE